MKITNLNKICLLVLVLFGSGQAGMSSTEIKAIQQAINDNNAEWTAVENSISQLSTDERRAMLGGLEEIPSKSRQPSLPSDALTTVLPTTFSWGNEVGYNWMTSVKNQGSCGSCWAFAAGGMFEARERIRLGLPNLNVDVSEQNMVSCWHNCTAWYMSYTLDNFANLGCPDESCFIYTSDNGTVAPCSNRCEDWDQRNFNIMNNGYWYYPGVDAIKEEIMNDGPVAVWMMIYTDFYSYGGGIYEHVTGGEEGGHFVVIYGWDDNDNCWLVKNSWDTSWGEIGPDGQGGWFRIRMGTNEASCEKWVYYLEPYGCNDTDGDGYCASEDNCPNISNPEQIDFDIDGVGDLCDDCIDTDFDGFGNPGYGNTCQDDNCLSIYNPDQSDSDNDGLGDQCDAREVLIDTIATPKLKLVISNEGTFGLSGAGGVNMDYSEYGDCDPTADVYLFSGTPVISYQNIDLGTTVADNAFFNDRDFKFIWGKNLTTPTETTADFDIFQTGTLITTDSTFAMDLTFWAPKNLDDGNFIIQKKEISKYKDNNISNLMIGDIVDWDIPPTSNTGGFDSSHNIIYQQGYTTTCQNNNNRFGAISFLGSHLIDEILLNIEPYSAYTEKNSLYINPALGFVPNELYSNMRQPGYSSISANENLHSVMTHVSDIELNMNDTLCVYSALITIQNGSVEELQNTVIRAREWVKTYLGLRYGCCVPPFRGNVDNSLDNVVDISDLVFFVAFMFSGGEEPPCMDEADVDGSTGIDISDLVGLTAYMFSGGAPPADCP